MLREFGELLDRYTQDKPLLLVTEDLHWSDHATVNLIDHAARRRGTARWMWLATFRVAELIAEDHPMKALRHELRLHRLSEEILVDPFSEQELADYVARRLGGADWPDTFLQALHRHTDGLPLFAANVIDDLLAQGALDVGALARDAQLTFDALSVPESLAGVMEKQIGRLHVDQTSLLEAASACGIEFRPPWWRRCSGGMSTGGPAMRPAGAVVSSGWPRPGGARREWRPGSALRFCHALIRRVFRERMGALARASCIAVWRWCWPARRTPRSRPLNWRRSSSSGRTPTRRCPTTRRQPRVRCSSSRRWMPCAWSTAASRCQSLPLWRPGAGPVGHAPHAARRRGCRSDGRQRRRDLAVVRAGAGRHGGLAPTPAAKHGTARTGAWAVLARRTSEARELAERSLAQALQRRDPVLTVAACDLLGQIIKLEGPPGDAIAVLEQGIQAATALDERTLQSAFVLDPLVNMQAALAIPLLLDGCDQRSRPNPTWPWRVPGP